MPVEDGRERPDVPEKWEPVFRKGHAQKQNDYLLRGRGWISALIQ
jgi:hypothetical protein